MSGCFRLLDHEHEMLEVHQGVTCRSCQQTPLLGRRVSLQLESECLVLSMALCHQSGYSGFDNDVKRLCDSDDSGGFSWG